MSHQLAIDFGTTNSLIAHWQDGAAHLLALPGLSDPTPDHPPLIPSLLYVENGRIAAGQDVRARGLDLQPDNRLFRNFKRGIAAAEPAARLIDGVPWTDRDASRQFLGQLLAGLPYPAAEIEQIVITAPVAAFERYQSWLVETVAPCVADPARVRLVDESTAAALGYAVTEPGALVLVFDFGGGSLDLSLVQLPESTKRWRGRASAEVIAKAGRFLGGSDVDQWLLAEVLRRIDLPVAALGLDYAALLTRCEQAKIALSSSDRADLDFSAGGRSHHLALSRADLDDMLRAHGFDFALRHIVDQLLHTARQKGVFREDVRYVLLVGGTSLMPAVQQVLCDTFGAAVVRAHKPFTAVVEGALQIAAGYGLDDTLIHSYGLRHLDAATGTHAYEEILPAGTRCPTPRPLEIVLSAAHAQQAGIEFVIGEIDTDAVALVEIAYEDGQAVFVAQADQQAQQITALNADDPPVARLKPTGIPDQERVKAAFSIDDQRRLRLTVTDLKSGKKLLRDVVIGTVR